MKPRIGLSCLLLAFVSPISLGAQSTVFTYQGRLWDGAKPANGSYALRFRLADAVIGGNYVGPALTNPAVMASNGIFTAALDFGGAVFDGSARWLEIAVRTNGSPGSYTSLSPRQAVTATPYAVQALNAGTAASYNGAVTDGQLSGNIARLNGSNLFSGWVQFNNPSNLYTGAFSGNGAGLTNSPGGAMQPFTLGTTNLDNASWLAQLSASFAQYKNYNRYNLSNTYAQIRNRKPLTVMFLGDGLVDEMGPWRIDGNPFGAGEAVGTSLYTNVFFQLTNLFGLAGYIAPAAPAFDWAQYAPFPYQALFGQNTSFSKTTNWWAYHMIVTNDGSGALAYLIVPVNADVYCFCWVSWPWGGNIVLKTNSVYMATVSGRSAVAIPHILWWTNGTHSTTGNIQYNCSGNGTNIVVALGWIDSSSSGIIAIEQTCQSTRVDDWAAVPPGIVAGMYTNWRPNLIIHDWYVDHVHYPATPGNFQGFQDFVRTNLPNTDVVMSSSPGVNVSYEIDALIAAARSNNNCVVFDGLHMVSDWHNLMNRGLAMTDGGHLTAEGYSFFSKLLWNYLEIPDVVGR